MLFVFTACNDNDPLEPVVICYETTGQITGHDLALCACCGGTFITMEDSLFEYRFNELPESATFEIDSEAFPIDVKFNWSPDPDMEACSDAGFNYIIIDEIELN